MYIECINILLSSNVGIVIVCPYSRKVYLNGFVVFGKIFSCGILRLKSYTFNEPWDLVLFVAVRFSMCSESSDAWLLFLIEIFQRWNKAVFFWRFLAQVCLQIQLITEIYYIQRDKVLNIWLIDEYYISKRQFMSKNQ